MALFTNNSDRYSEIISFCENISCYHQVVSPNSSLIIVQYVYRSLSNILPIFSLKMEKCQGVLLNHRKLAFCAERFTAPERCHRVLNKTNTGADFALEPVTTGVAAEYLRLGGHVTMKYKVQPNFCVHVQLNNEYFVPDFFAEPYLFSRIALIYKIPLVFVPALDKSLNFGYSIVSHGLLVDPNDKLQSDRSGDLSAEEYFGKSKPFHFVETFLIFPITVNNFDSFYLFIPNLLKQNSWISFSISHTVIDQIHWQEASFNESLNQIGQTELVHLSDTQPHWLGIKLTFDDILVLQLRGEQCRNVSFTIKIKTGKECFGNPDTIEETCAGMFEIKKYESRTASCQLIQNRRLLLVLAPHTE